MLDVCLCYTVRIETISNILIPLSSFKIPLEFRILHFFVLSKFLLTCSRLEHLHGYRHGTIYVHSGITVTLSYSNQILINIVKSQDVGMELYVTTRTLVGHPKRRPVRYQFSSFFNSFSCLFLVRT